jgi:hypothetical protein
MLKWAGSLIKRNNRDGILKDAQSIAPVPLSEFDKDKLLLNCLNGTLNLRNFALQPHNPRDRITKLAFAKYDPAATSERWERFISLETGFDAPPTVVQAVAEYREEADVIGIFLSEHTVGKESGRLKNRFTHYTRFTSGLVKRVNGVKGKSGRSAKSFSPLVNKETVWKYEQINKLKRSNLRELPISRRLLLWSQPIKKFVNVPLVF